MKLRLATFAVTLLLLAPASTLCQERLRLTKYIYGQKYTVKVLDEDIEEMPSWNPEAEEVPLSLRKAVEVARKNLPRFLPKDAEKWALDTISLTQVGKPGSNKWLYQVDFTNFGLLGSNMDFMFSIYVKMDGTIVEPQVVPDDGKVRVY